MIRRFLCLAVALTILTLSSCDNQTSNDSDVPRLKSMTHLKIVNWNVLYGFNHNQAIEKGADWLASQHPDVVALQELNGITEQSLADLAANSWDHQHSAILKENGFPVGLTSSKPIEVIKRQVDGFHHGYLHCQTHGSHFFVVHFWPGKDHEGQQVGQEIKSLLADGKSVVLMGDFNTHSARDAEFLKQRTSVKPQFNIVKLFEEIGMVDLVAKHSPDTKYSFPSPITIPKWSADEEVMKSKRQRIDFVFVSPEMASESMDAQVISSQEVESISDHYPVIATMRQGGLKKSGK